MLSATGPFTDTFLTDGRGHRLRPTLGVHLVFDAARVPHGGRALVLRSPRDNRLFFVLPAGARTIIGTTDTDWPSPRPPRIDDDIRARGEDVAYLLEAANHAFPSLGLAPDDVLSTYAALRPLLATGAHTPSETSREHEIARAADGLLVIAGGKLTTLRRMGEEAVDRVVEALHGRRARARRSRAAPPPIARCPAAAPRRRRSAARAWPPTCGPPRGGVRRPRADAVLAARALRRPSSRAGSIPSFRICWAEVVHAVRAEHARDVADVLRRRVPLFRDARDQGLAAARGRRRDPGRRARLDAGAPRALARDYRAAVERSRRWRDELGRAAPVTGS